MLTTNLIDKDDVRTYKQISYTSDSTKFNDICLTTQIEDIAPLLGEELFNAILNNPASYTGLLDGGAYTVGGITYQNYGLKAVICYYFYARHVMFNDVTDVPYGLVQKLDNEGKSQPVAHKTKEALYQMNRQTAFTIWRSVENYLIRTNEPLFNNINLCSTLQNRKNNQFKISKIG